MSAATELFDAARAVMDKAYVPYSKFPVGAALRTADGKIFTGANMENASYPEGWCAETTMLGQWHMAGGGAIEAIAVVASRMDEITPCGGCRQRLAEFTGPDTKLHLCDQNGVTKTVTMGDILPLGFRGDVLK